MSNFLRDHCGVGTGPSCCRYVTCGADGSQCGKLDPAIKRAIDERCDTMKAKGDRCDGLADMHERANA